MKKYLILTILCFCTLIVYSQKLKLEKASPFTAVKWEKEQPVVQFDKEWYHFEKLEEFSKQEILDFCKKQFGEKWQKRFSEDLVDVLNGLHYQPQTQVKLQLSQKGVSKTYIGTFTYDNRQQSLQYNKDKSKPNHTFPKKITVTEAIEDLKQFRYILKTKGSYVQLSTFDYTSAIKELSTSIKNKKKDVDINQFTNEISKIMSQIGDRHSRIKNEAFNKQHYTNYTLRLPFAVAPLKGKIIALKQNVNDVNYTYYDKAYPTIKSINGIAVETLINSYNYRDKKAPAAARMTRGSRAIQNFGALLFKNNKESLDALTVVFTDGYKEKVESFTLTHNTQVYTSKLVKENYNNRIQVKNGNFIGLSKRLEHNIAYLNIPEMYHYDEVDGLENYIKRTLSCFEDTRALIIDVRNNPGGGREIIKTIASYIVQPKQSPWIANVAYLRTEEIINADEQSMSGRYLYSYTSEEFTDRDRTAIDVFNTTFKLQKSLNKSAFSSPFYMVLHNGKTSYKKPVYILVNENTFSAASVFASAFKGLPNVTIVGETTDGSSGNSIKLHLKNSNISVKISTMLSFQRNGKTLDGNGTTPDISIPVDETLILKGIDNQLMSLIELLNFTKN